jgi:hypothetical protein
MKKNIFVVLLVLLCSFVFLSYMAYAPEYLVFNNTNSVATTSNNIPVGGTDASFLVQNFTSSGNYISRVGINVSNWTTIPASAGTYVKIYLLYNSSVSVYNGSRMYSYDAYLPVLDNSIGLTNGTYASWDLSSQNWAVNTSQTYSIAFYFLNGTGNVNCKQSTYLSGFSSACGTVGVTTDDLKIAIYQSNTSGFQMRGNDIFNSASLVNLSLSVNGSNYNQTFYSTNSSVTVYPLADMSGNNATVVQTTAINYTPYGRIGGAYNFDGATSQINYSDTTGTRMATPTGTIYAWINPKTIGEGNAGRIIDKS